MAPREGNSIVKHGVLDERLKGLKVADLSICPDNVGCNTYSTALLIGEKCAVLTAEDLGYTGRALDMRVPEYHAPRYVKSVVLVLRRCADILIGRLLDCRVCERTDLWLG
jgi:alcohol oxidase